MCMMNVKETFLRLTTKTYPHGTESELMHLLPSELETDEFGNKFIQIGEKTSCMFTSHLDTATSAKSTVNHIFEENIIKTDGTSILGADDKAGVTVMLYMIENKVPGLYYFFLGEEVGCIGSKKLSTKCKDEKIEGITKVISFDRRGYDSVITFQASSRCCSDVFGEALSKELNKAEILFNYKNDPTGIYTDSAQFTRIYPECTNISVGYKSEHTFGEQQDINHLDLLAKACVLVDWENLPAERDPTKYEYSRYSSYGDYDEWGCGGYGSEDFNWSGSGRNNYIGYTRPVVVDDLTWFFDPDFFEISSVITKKYSNELVKVDFCKARIHDEEFDIKKLLYSLEVDWEDVKWDGFELTLKHSFEAGDHTTKCTRKELSEFLPSLDFWKKELETYKDDSTKGLVSTKPLS
jgi:hypothetical protein